MEETRQHPTVEEQRRRLRGFAWHVLGWILVCAACFGLNFVILPDVPWFLLPLVGWGTVLAVHVAYVMGLFAVFSDRK